MSTARILTRNLLANWVSFGANLAVMFFLSPFVIHTLGETVYGIWSLLTVVAGYMGICDLGVRASTGRYITLYLGKEDHQRVADTIRTSVTLFSLLGAVFLLVGFVVGLAFPYFFPSTPDEYRVIVALLMPALAVNLWLATLSAVFSSILTAHDRFDLARAVDVGVLVLRATGTILALKAGYGIVGLTLTILICGAFALTANHFLARRVYPSFRLRPLRLIKGRLRELFGYGIWAAIATNAYWIIGQTDLLLIGMLISVSKVTVYSVGAMLVYYSTTILGKIPMTYFPPLQRAAARREMSTVRSYYVQQLRLSLAIGIPMYLGFVIFGSRFITLWMGHPVEFPDSSVTAAAAVLAVLSLARLLALPAMGGEWVLAAVERVRFVSLATCTEAAINLGLSVFFVTVMKWGILGVAAGTLVARGLTRLWLIPWQAGRETGLPAWDFLKILMKGLVAGAGFSLWSLLIRELFTEESWLIFSNQVALALLGYAPMAFFLMLSRPEQKRILTWLLRVVFPKSRNAELGDPESSQLL